MHVVTSCVRGGTCGIIMLIVLRGPHSCQSRLEVRLSLSRFAPYINQTPDIFIFTSIPAPRARDTRQTALRPRGRERGSARDTAVRRLAAPVSSLCLAFGSSVTVLINRCVHSCYIDSRRNRCTTTSTYYGSLCTHIANTKFVQSWSYHITYIARACAYTLAIFRDSGSRVARP